MSEEQHSHEPGSPGYEKRDTATLQIALYGIVSVIVIALILVGLNELFVVTREQIIREVVLQPASPRLRAIRAQEAEILNTYALIDSARGVVRIPIEQAMKLTAERAFTGGRKADRQ